VNNQNKNNQLLEVPFIDIYRKFYSKPDWDDKFLMIQNVLYVVFKKEFDTYNNNMNYWTMQLHPNNLGWEKETELLSKEFLIGLGDWEEKTSQQSQFENEMRVGDIVLIRRGSEIIALVEVTGDYEYTEDTSDLAWFERRRQIEILDWYRGDYGLNVSARKTLERCQNKNTATFSSILKWLETIKQRDMLTKYTELLKSNMNLILTGAPGTGKTYLAKQIALSILFNKQDEKKLNENEKQILENHFCFVQFHPSYDYTDFVEGLRAEDLNGQVIFNLHNGIFKAFCKKALVSQGNMDISVLYDDLVDQIENGDIETIKLKNGNPSQKLSITTHKGDCNIHWFDQKNEGESRNAVTKQRLLKLYEKFNSLDKLNSMANINEDIRDVIKGCDTSMYWAVLNYILNQSIESDNKPYIFVIDEINRGEISKIFGELFFSIDPGYRGEKGKVQTQYANIQSNNTIYDYRLGLGWFYVPENIYIIGTMNDIDRSVESMDFAMRRRFAWEEIKAIDRIEMWNGNIDAWKEEAKERMLSLNEAIEKINGLSSAYHIGPAYFLKLENYNGDFERLWTNHLQGVLSEYLRGFPNIEEGLSNLKNAYNLL
jgi:hypothetical protein